MKPHIKRIAVIGGGLCGIHSIAGCKEAGMEPVCFELTDKFGGNWCYREEAIDGIPSIMPTTIINISKEVGAFSAFPPRKEYNNYMKHEEVFQYISEYAAARDLLRHINFNSEVTLVKTCKDYDVTGKWEVTVRNTLSDKVTTEVFDGVMVCIGHINRPKMAHFPEEEIFKGKIMHTHSLKRVNEFHDKNVVVVGIGCSGLDAAVESSKVAKQVYVSTHSGAHILHRLGSHGYPIDYILIRRYLLFFINILPIKIVSWLLETLFLDPIFDHRLYTIKPKKPFMCQDPSMNDQIASKLHSGSVIQKPDIERFTEKGVIFKGETSETKADVVILATGYTWKFPFFEEGVVVQDNGKINLYKCMFPIHLQHSTLATLGFILPFGAGWPLGEMQIRWAAQIMSGNSKLPSKSVMCKDVSDRYTNSLKRYGYDEKNDKVSLRVDYLQYMDEIAVLMGVKPNLWKYFFTDFQLFIRLLFGPVLAYQYRLEGPHRWEGAREAIMTSDERMHWPMQKRKEASESFFMKMLKKIIKILCFMLNITDY